jgi:hypothetical protein
MLAAPPHPAVAPGSWGQIRTSRLHTTNVLLCQMSYPGSRSCAAHHSRASRTICAMETPRSCASSRSRSFNSVGIRTEMRTMRAIDPPEQSAKACFPLHHHPNQVRVPFPLYLCPKVASWGVLFTW